MTDGHESNVSGTVLITIDSLRADALRPGIAPNLSRLASRGTTFEQAFAHGNWTPFAFPSILGSEPVFSDSADIGLTGASTLAEILQDAGVATGGYNAANGFLTSYWGYDRGFDRFETFIDDFESASSRYLAAHPTVRGWVQLLTSPVRRAKNAMGAGETKPFVDVSHLWDVERHATAFLAEVSEPFFLWIHYMDAHTPYVPAPKHIRAVDASRMNFLKRLRAHIHTGLGRQINEDTLSVLRSLYLGAVHQVDASIGRLLQTLRDTGRRDSTLVIATGDHGEAFQEHGHLAHYPTLYDELIRVPFVVDHPHASSNRVTHPVGHEGIPPTICDAMDVPSSVFPGRSVLSAVFDRKRSVDRRPIVSIAIRGERLTQQPIPRRLDDGDVLVSARTDRYTYIYHSRSGRKELYDRADDPEERHNLFASNTVSTAVVRPLHRAVMRRLRRLGHENGDRSPTQADPSPELTRRLEALGYQ